MRHDTLRAGSRVAVNTLEHPNPQSRTVFYIQERRVRAETVVVDSHMLFTSVAISLIYH